MPYDLHVASPSAATPAALGAALGLLALAACADAPTGPASVAGPALAVGGAFSCLVAPEGHAWCWGVNAWGQLGAATGERCGSEPCARRPVATAPRLAFRTLSASVGSSVWSGHVCGITLDAEAFCWGVDKTQLGRELTAPDYCVAQNGLVAQPCSRDPVRVATLDRLAGIASGDFHSCGVTVDGVVWCWGSDSNGQLGSLDDEACGEFELPCSFVPVTISTDRRFRQVVAGSIHSCALSDRGEAWCWGNNDDGQLGHASPLGPGVPAETAAGLEFVQLTAGRRHTCGLTAAGEAYCWGDNTGGQLGGGTSAPALTEVRVRSAVRFTALSAGWWHTCGLGEDGSAFCWGSNVFGQLGGTPAEPEVCAAADPCATAPVTVAGGRRFVAVGAGGAHTCALAADGRAYCWGDNSLGQLGDGNMAGSSRPVPVAGVEARG